MSEWVNEWHGLVHDFVCTLNFREFWVLLHAKNLGGWTLIEEVDWWLDQQCHWHQQKLVDDVINKPLWSRRLRRVSFNLIACVEPVKQDDHYFHAKILVCKFQLGSRKAWLHMRRSFCHPLFYAKSFMQNYRRVPELFKKTSRWRYTPPPPHTLPPKKKFAKV